MEPAIVRKYLGLREIDWRIVTGLFALNTICLFFYRQLDFAAYAYRRPPLLTFLEEGVGCFAGFLVFPLIYLTAIRFPLITSRWRVNLAMHLLAVCLISAIHTTLIALLRAVLFPPLGFGAESYGSLPVRYPMEFSHLFIYYWVGVSLIYFFHEIRFARDRELRQVRLERKLAEAKLQNLRLQLEPHFLFNALNAISAAVYENPRAADRMIGQLGELLRHLLQEDRSQFVSLDEELELVRLYTGIMEARLEDRLSVALQIEEGARHAMVPQLVLQPLVENAIRHGMDATFRVRITIEARCDESTLVLSVRDHGLGIDESAPIRFGIGLSNSRERLEALHGSNAAFQLRNAPGGGTIAEVRLPFKEEIRTRSMEAIRKHEQATT